MEKRTLPKSDLAFFTWSKGFIAAVADDAAALGISATMRDEAIAAHTTFAAAFAVATAPGTRTSVAVLAKNEAAAAWRRVAAQIVALVRAQPTVSDEARFRLGIEPRASNVRIGTPEAEPFVLVNAVSGRTVHLRVDASPLGRRGRPAKVAGLVLFSHVGDAPPPSLADWRYEGTSSAVALSVTFAEALPAGQMVWFSAQWLSPRLDAGPPSRPVSTHLSAGLRSAPLGMRRAA